MQQKLYNLIIKRRSIRLFRQRKVPWAVIKKGVNAARLAPCAANLQFLEYLVVKDKLLREKIFTYTRWAGYLYPRRIPPAGMRPTFYVFILMNKEKSQNFDLRDVGAAAENMILTFLEQGVGACWIASLDRKSLGDFLNIPKNYEIDSVIAGGFAAEEPKLEQDAKNIKYWLDKKNRLHVPKRPLKDIIYFDSLTTSQV